ncbi:MAG: alpha/beta fold hydrolase [Clostridia bacterium]|nr:alpha/beta fold hydrolase [Clostridia bacterium]
MTITVEEFNVPSSDRVHTLKGKVYVPEGEIKGLFQIVHGMTEYIDRYDLFMQKIAARGYICFGFNNLGHGTTAKNDSELGFIAPENGYRYLIEDVNRFYYAVYKKYPVKKYILMGHSMGSFIARLSAEKHSEDVDTLIICGTGGPQIAAPIGYGLAAIIKKIYGEKHYSKLLDKLIFGAYNSGFEGLSKYDWLTKDREIIEKYQQDKYCTFRFTVSAIKDLLMLTILSNRSAWFKNLSKNLPVLLISGTDDPVGGYSKGVKTVFKLLRQAEILNVNLFLYENCRHEILNDSCKEEVFNDIIGFLE